MWSCEQALWLVQSWGAHLSHQYSGLKVLPVPSSQSTTTFYWPQHEWCISLRWHTVSASNTMTCQANQLSDWTCDDAVWSTTLACGFTSPTFTFLLGPFCEQINVLANQLFLCLWLLCLGSCLLWDTNSNRLHIQKRALSILCTSIHWIYWSCHTDLVLQKPHGLLHSDFISVWRSGP